MTELTPRQREVLEAVLSEFIVTAEPVGSRIISRKYISRLSPATIRNVLADLEEIGLLSQPHTSAGRVPTNEGFRCYVDSVVRRKFLPFAEKEEIRRQFEGVRRDLESLLRETSRILSRFSRYAGMVWSPLREADGVFRTIEFFRIDQRNILSLVVYPSGILRSRIIPVEEDLDSTELARMSEFLNRELAGLPPEKLKEKIFRKVEEGIWEFILTEALGLSDPAGLEGEVYIEGQLNIIELPDFPDRKRLQEILRTLEEKRKIIRLLNAALKQEGMQVFIGVEEIYQELKGLSLVSAVYGTEETLRGRLAVLGPTRMDYARIIPLVEYTSKVVSDLLREN